MKRIVTQAHVSEYPNPISFAAGETVQLGNEDTEFPGWIWVTTQDGNQGWAPLAYLELAADSRTARTCTSYNARELNTRSGDVVVVLDELSNWTRVQNAAGEKGWVPSRTLSPEP
jgi:SH3-like domain-containing protein